MIKVSRVKCNSYNKNEVSNAILKALELIDYKFKDNQKILIKPNVLGGYKPDQAITTNDKFLEELIKILKKHKSKIYIGESSATNTKNSFVISGISKLVKKYRLKLIDFDYEKTYSVEIDSKIKKIHLPKIIKEMDLVINVPKLKTHGLTGITAGVKNLYGFIPGNAKSTYHRIYNNTNDFSKLLLEINDKIRPGLTIVDGIVGIEGMGPGTSGEKINSKLIFASTDTISLDKVIAKTIGFNENEVGTIKYSKKYIFDKEIKIVGDELFVKFKKPRTTIYKPFISMVLRVVPKPKIDFDHDLCIKCHECEKICPTKSIILDPYPICDHKNCIKCLCCIEVCPKKAITLKDSQIFIFLKNIYMKLKKSE